MLGLDEAHPKVLREPVVVVAKSLVSSSMTQTGGLGAPSAPWGRLHRVAVVDRLEECEVNLMKFKNAKCLVLCLG